MEQLRPDIAFIGACAIDGAAGVSAFDADDAEFKQLVVRQSRIKLVAAVNEKVGTVAPHPVLPVTAFDSIIVEKSLHPAKRAALDFAQAVLVTA
jgi:DeoR/GlpR family transcriptional regulator of sugar metabolism